ncbi:energy transducer TonB [bacterium]|nr:energy transducer TonB [bacterium]
MSFVQIDYKKIDADSKFSYTKNVKRALVITLALLNLLIYILPGIEVKVKEVELPQVTINVENVPLTRQSRRTPPPPKPTVPVPSDKESIPEDLTIEETELRYTTIFDFSPGHAPPFAGIKITPPRPIAWVFPEYPEDEKKRGVQGVVKLSIHIDEEGKVTEVVVLDNTTGSQKCQKAAVAAAYGSRFYPAKEGAKNIDYWITQPYRFDLRK